MPPGDFKLHYSCRQQPSKYYFQQVRCLDCLLLYSSPTFPPEVIWQLYLNHQGDDYLAEIAANNHCQILQNFLPLLKKKEKMLELGPGSGKLLGKLARFFKHQDGVGPEERIQDLTDARLIPHSYDLIISVLTLEHVFNPGQILQQICQLLHSQGLIFFILHNEQSIYHRSLGRFSPLYDLQHLQLFSLATFKKWQQPHQLNVVQAGLIWDFYPLAYWSKLLSIPAFSQCSWQLPIYGGNYFVAAQLF